MSHNIKTHFKFISAFVLIAELSLPLFASLPASAATPPFALSYLRTNRHLALAATGGTVCATTPATTPGTETSLKITFPTVPTGITTGYVVNATAANWTTTVTNLPAGAAAWPGIGTATNVTGKIVTFPSGALLASTNYCFNFSGTSTLTNASAGNSFKAYLGTYNVGSSLLMQTEFGLAVVDGTTKFDQYAITATVPPIFIFFLESSIDSFPTDLDPTFVSVSSGVNFDITTNAKGGWIAWVKDSQQGLFSSTANYTIPTSGIVDGFPTTLAAGTEGYVLASDVAIDAAGGCTVVSAPEYDKTNGVIAANQAKAGSTLSSNFQPVSSCTGVAPATSNGDKVLLTERASISGGTPAGTDYSDILTVVAAGNF